MGRRPVKERAEFRLRYPVLARPRLQLDVAGERLTGRVLDLSESAMLIELEGRVGFAVDDPLAGRCRLLQGKDFDFSGVCLRVSGHSAAVVFDRGSRVPINLLFEEQRTVRARFPEWR